MLKQLKKTWNKYIENIDKVTFFAIFIILTLALSPILSSFTSVGSAFIRFTSIYADLTTIQILILGGIGTASIVFIGMFLSGLISLIKLQETLDYVTYRRVMATFKKHITKISLFLAILTLTSLAIGTTLSYLGTPQIITHLIILVLWITFTFTPQVAVIENFGVTGSMKDAVTFIKDHPIPLVKYIVLGFILMFILVIIEAMLGQVLIWEHRIVSILLVSLVILPILQIYATELYLKRYPLTNI